MNTNNSVVVAFKETNTTRILTTDFTQNIDVTQYIDPFDPTTNMIFNFSHVILAINNNSDLSLFSMMYTGSLFGLNLSRVLFLAVGLAYQLA